MPNNAIAEEVGIAPSTCLSRIRSLIDRGVIKGFHADVDPAAIGLGVQVLIAVRLKASTRSHVGSFAREVAKLPGVMNVFFLGGADDFMLHVAASNTDGVRDFVDHFHTCFVMKALAKIHRKEAVSDAEAQRAFELLKMQKGAYYLSMKHMH